MSKKTAKTRRTIPEPKAERKDISAAPRHEVPSELLSGHYEIYLLIGVTTNEERDKLVATTRISTANHLVKEWEQSIKCPGPRSGIAPFNGDYEAFRIETVDLYIESPHEVSEHVIKSADGTLTTIYRKPL